MLLFANRGGKIDSIVLVLDSSNGVEPLEGKLHQML
jgi:hypothetical protein